MENLSQYSEDMLALYMQMTHSCAYPDEDRWQASHLRELIADGKEAMISIIHEDLMVVFGVQPATQP